jgi:hypothetical protein
MKTSQRFLIMFSLLALGTIAMGAQGRPTLSIDQVLQAHGQWALAPRSVQVTGTSTTQSGASPVQITATNLEEVLLQYENRKHVATPTAHFQADSSRMALEPAPSGFAQLDITGVFFLLQLRQRSVTATAAETVNLPSGPATRLRFRGDRKEWHYRRFEVPDQVDLYINAAGLLEVISRTLYEGEPRWERTMAVRFTDYRLTQGERLPYRIERYEDGRVTETIVVDRYEWDLPAATSLFARGRMR